MAQPDTWYCDSCGDTVGSRGLLVWRDDDNHRAVDFRIVHKEIDNPACDSGRQYPSSLELTEVVGEEGQAWLFSLLTAGPIIGTTSARIGSVDQWADMYRRLQVADYEEARRNFASAAVQEEYGDANEVLPYTPRELKKIATPTGND